MSSPTKPVSDDDANFHYECMLCKLFFRCSTSKKPDVISPVAIVNDPSNVGIHLPTHGDVSLINEISHDIAQVMDTVEDGLELLPPTLPGVEILKLAVGVIGDVAETVEELTNDIGNGTIINDLVPSEVKAQLEIISEIAELVSTNKDAIESVLELLPPTIPIVEDIKNVVNTIVDVAETITEPVVETITEPVVETVPEPVVEAVPEPVVEALPEPVVEALPEPVTEAVPVPVTEA